MIISIYKASRFFLAVSLVIPLLVQPSSAEPVRVTNGAQPTNGSRTLILEELWTVGGEDSEFFFGLINRVLIDDQENIYLLDGQLSEVQVISPEGEFLRTLGREGDGPGEFRGPSEMCFLPDGSLGVLQGIPGKVIRLNREDGTPAGSWPLSDPDTGGFLQMQGMRVGGGHVMVSGSHQVFDQETGHIQRDNFLSYVDVQTGLLGKEITRRKVQLDLSNLRLDENDLVGGPEGRYDVLPDGRTVVAIPRNEYEVSIFAPDGSLECVFTREFTSWQRDEHASNIWKRILDQVERTQAPGSKISWEETEQDVQALFVGPDGDIWIQNSRGRWEPPEGVFTTFDVFTTEGVFKEEVRFVCEGDPRRDMLFFSGKDLVFKIGEFWDAALSQFGGAGSTSSDDEEPAPVTVTCYRIKS
jgi:hypothetical protein